MSFQYSVSKHYCSVGDPSASKLRLDRSVSRSAKNNVKKYLTI
jgi:hypothetical protein